MVKSRSTHPGKARPKDPSAGGKRSAMAFEEDPGVPFDHGDVEDETTVGTLAAGIAVIAGVVKTLPNGAGVYRMFNRRGDALYVGKAQNLRRRVTSYTQLTKLPRRLQRMVAETVAMEVVETASEVEALLLESNLIKRLMPRYNVLLRDDKSFPYIFITGDHPVPQITKHRGAQTRNGDYFGPFASAGAVNRTITALERAFLLRSCSDAVYGARTRPCLMYQIKRCSAPCVAYIDSADYGSLVAQARDFLSGRASNIQQDLRQAMESAAEKLDFESAALYRDRIRALAHIQSHQDINVEGIDDADVIAAEQQGGQTCIQVFFFRAGRNYGNRAYFPSHDKSLDAAAVLGAFIAQFYDNKPAPKLVLLSEQVPEAELIAEALSHNAGRRVTLLRPQRGRKKSLVENAARNANEALARRLSESASQRKVLEALSEFFGLDGQPQRIEVYDNSHIQGSNAYGAMIVAGPEGFTKKAYRKFLIKGAATAARDNKIKGAAEPGGDIKTKGAATQAGDDKPQQDGFQPGDDYAMMREVLTRRFSRSLREDPGRDSADWPDLVLLDGGRGQLSVGQEVMADLGLSDIKIAAIAKGPDRNAGRERIFLPDQAARLLEPRDPLLYYLQRLRDEAHRFAIGSHRSGRSNTRLRSQLDDVPGIGAKRKKALLHHFGSASAVSRAGLADLEAVDGISEKVAKRIYDHFNQTP